MKKIIFLYFITIGCFAQFSKTHYIPPIAVSSPNMVNDHYLYISTPNTNNVAFKIIQIGGPIITGVVSNSQPYIYTISSDINSPLFVPKSSIGIVTNKGYNIEAEDLVYVSVRINSSFNGNNGGFDHAGGLVSKGNSALGKTFRLGAMQNPLFDPSLLNFASILATENNTKIKLSNIPVGTIFSDGSIYTKPIEVTLNKNESYIIALENLNEANTISNSAKMIGALVESDKSVVVNSGSFGGSNSSQLRTNQNGDLVPVGRDIGFDQIVSSEKTGKEYIFVKGRGSNELEKVLLIADRPNTQIFLNGNIIPYQTITNPGDYVVIDGSQFSNGDLYVRTTENVFAYQSIGGSMSSANQNLFFVPPLNCAATNSVNNIPFIQSIGKVDFKGIINIVTESNAQIKINGVTSTETPVTITGNPGFVRYSFTNLSGNISINSTKQVYVSYFGSNNAATFGGYYSGFDLKPEIIYDKIVVDNSSCIPNLKLKINSLSSYDTFQWTENGNEILGATNNVFQPTRPGYYQVKGGISGCSSNGFIESDRIPVSNCPTDFDNDNINDNFDIDNDNDGIINCVESYGNQEINLSNSLSGNLSVGTYSNSFTGSITTKVHTALAESFLGKSDGSFVTQIPMGKANPETGTEASSLTYKINFTKPINLGIEYISTANASDLLNSNAEYIINSDIDKSITVLNPDNQLLIDTNYDGIYETGITEYSSFEIRFRVNSTVSLLPGTGTFKFLSHMTNSLSISHINLSDTETNKSTFKIFASCIPKDTDSDGIIDELDSDSDNDGILDVIENQIDNSVAISNIDINKNGLDDAFEKNMNNTDTDNDGVFDYLDLDSDNDGVLDAIETGNDLDNDGIGNYRDLDSDGDNCFDVIEAGFDDENKDGRFGNSLINFNDKGMVVGATYSNPQPNYIISAPIIIYKEPKVDPTCELQNVNITIEDNGASSYQWQLSTNGITWSDLIDGANYSGTNAKTLSILNPSNSMNGLKYRVQINKNGNSCGLTSQSTTLSIHPLPVVNDISIVQCDDDLDLKTFFNLNIKNNLISTNAFDEEFSYYLSENGAKNGETDSDLIDNPSQFENTTSPMTVWSRVKNKVTGCHSIAKITLIVSVSNIPSSYSYVVPTVCDDDLASDGTISGDPNTNSNDGITTFDLTNAIKDLENQLPQPLTNYTIKYYRNKTDALLQYDTNGKSLAISTNEYTNFRNDIPNAQNIWVRVNNGLSSDCGDGFGEFIKLSVGKLPNINLNLDGIENQLICSDNPNFDVKLEAGINDGTPSSDYNYVWSLDEIVLSGETSPTLNTNKEGVYKIEVFNNLGCSRNKTIKVIASSVAKINSIDIEDLNDTNTVVIKTLGQGNYQYSLNEPNGFFQDSNVFNNVPAGIHDVYINDKDGCGMITKNIAVVGAPKFFTPNGDGFNDVWNIKGINSIQEKSVIYIYDRYGKIMKFWNLSSSQGWDGTFKGLPTKADDYWYVIKLEDGRETKGHFSLKR